MLEISYNSNAFDQEMVGRTFSLVSYFYLHSAALHNCLMPEVFGLCGQLQRKTPIQLNFWT